MMKISYTLLGIAFLQACMCLEILETKYQTETGYQYEEVYDQSLTEETDDYGTENNTTFPLEETTTEPQSSDSDKTSMMIVISVPVGKVIFFKEYMVAFM